jgi:hypothetical protein
VAGSQQGDLDPVGGEVAAGVERDDSSGCAGVGEILGQGGVVERDGVDCVNGRNRRTALYEVGAPAIRAQELCAVVCGLRRGVRRLLVAV